MMLIALKLFNNMIKAKLRPKIKSFIAAGISLHDGRVLGMKFHKKCVESNKILLISTKLKVLFSLSGKQEDE